MDKIRVKGRSLTQILHSPCSPYKLCTLLTYVHAYCNSIYIQSHIYTYIHMHHYIRIICNIYVCTQNPKCDISEISQCTCTWIIIFNCDYWCGWWANRNNTGFISGDNRHWKFLWGLYYCIIIGKHHKDDICLTSSEAHSVWIRCEVTASCQLEKADTYIQEGME